MDGEVTEVRCSPARQIRLRSGAWDGGVVNADRFQMRYQGQVLERNGDGLITAARFSPLEYWRLGPDRGRRRAGNRAWSNAWRLPEKQA